MNSNEMVTTATGVRVNADTAAFLAKLAAERGETVMCDKHRAFEADNCPSCGTSRMSF